MIRGLSGAARAAAVLLGAALTAASPLSAARAPAQTLERYSFEVVWSVFPDLVLATGTIAIEERGDAYRIGMEARARVPFPQIEWDGFFATEGRIAPDGRAPETFQRISSSTARVERATIVWRGDGAPPDTALEISPPRPNQAVVDPEKIGPETIDPLTFVTLIYDSVIETNGESCNVTGTTWDGVRLADMEATTGDRLRAARVDCLISYIAIDGLTNAEGFEDREIQTVRTVRFEKRLGRWRPVWVRIEGEFAGFDSTFMTTFTPIE